jgi:hypothetical protein
MAHPNKFTVHQRIGQLENAVTELRKENKELRVHLAGALQTAVNDAKNLIQGSIRVPADGKDGAPGRDGVDGQSIVGPQGPAGDVLYVGPDELQTAVSTIRAEMVHNRAKALAAIYQAIIDNESTTGTHRRIFKMRLESLIREAGL